MLNKLQCELYASIGTKLKVLLISCLLLLLCSCNSIEREIEKTSDGVSKIHTVLNSESIPESDNLEYDKFYLMGYLGKLSINSDTEVDHKKNAYFWISDEEFTKTSFESFINKLETFNEDDSQISTDIIENVETYQWKASDDITMYAWIDDDTHANVMWCNQAYLLYTKESYGNSIVADYFPSISNTDEKMWAYLMSYQGYDKDYLLDNKIIDLDEWMPLEDYKGDYDVFRNESFTSYVREGTLFSVKGCFKIEIPPKTNKFTDLYFFTNSTIDDLQNEVCQLMQKEVDPNNYLSTNKSSYVFIKDGTYEIWIINKDKLHKNTELISTHIPSSDEYWEILYNEDYQENEEVYNLAVQGYWQLRNEMKNPSSLVIDGVKDHDGEIVFKYRGRNSFNAVVTEYAKYDGKKISSYYADIYYDSYSSKKLYWNTIVKFSKSSYCKYNPIGE